MGQHKQIIACHGVQLLTYIFFDKEWKINSMKSLKFKCTLKKKRPLHHRTEIFIRATKTVVDVSNR